MMVPSGRLKVKGRSVFQNGKLKSCWRFSSSRRSGWIAGGKEVPGEDTETGGGGPGWWGRGSSRGEQCGRRGGGGGTSAPDPGLFKGRPRTPAWGPGGEARGLRSPADLGLHPSSAIPSCVTLPSPTLLRPHP